MALRSRSILIFLLLYLPLLTFGQSPVLVCSEEALRLACAAGGTIQIDCDAVIQLRQPIAISKNVSISTFKEVTLTGSGNRLFDIEPNGRLVVSNLTISSGRATHGGAILSRGTLRLVNVRLERNIATGYIGATDFKGGGGAIFNLGGTVEAEQCHFIRNESRGALLPPRSGGYGGAIVNERGRLTLKSCTLAFNETTGADEGDRTLTSSAWPAEGGAVWSTGEVYIESSNFSSNKVTGNFGAPGRNSSGIKMGGDGSHAIGAAIYNAGNIRVHNSTFRANYAFGGNGGSGPDEIPAGPGIGPGAGGSAKGAGIYSGAGSIAVTGCFFRQNRAWAGSGGSGGMGPRGLDGTTFSRGGKGANGAKGPPAEGGALYLSGQAGITNSTFHSNHAAGGAGGYGGEGGEAGNTSAQDGVRISGDGGNGGDGGAASGGAIFVASGTCSIVHVTLSGNALIGSRGARGAWGPAYGDPDVILGEPGEDGEYSPDEGSQICARVAPGIRATVFADGFGEHYFGPINDLGYNFSNYFTPRFSDPRSSNGPFRLEAAGLNGGETETVMLPAGSPMLDRIPLPEIAFDQRGIARPQGGMADAGAVERTVLPGIAETRLTFELTSFTTAKIII